MTSARVLRHDPWDDVPGLVHGFLPGGATPKVSVQAPRQVHGTRVTTFDTHDPRPEADGLVTAAMDTRVGVVTADCVPLLMLARRAQVVAAVHAGWRGAAAGVVEQALAHMTTAFDVEPADVEVAMGPAIGPCCYEVGPEVRAAFVARTTDATAPAWSTRGGRDVFDLRAALRCLLTAAGVTSVAVLGPCTRCSPDYCSYRRDGSAAGRQWSIIGWA